MGNSTKMQQAITAFEKYIVNSKLSETQKQIYDVLVAMTKNPGEHDKTYLNQVIHNTIDITLEEKKKNIEKLLVNIQTIIPKLEEQLKLMKNKGYFTIEDKVVARENLSYDSHKGYHNKGFDPNQIIGPGSNDKGFDPNQVIGPGSRQHNKGYDPNQVIGFRIQPRQQIGSEVVFQKTVFTGEYIDTLIQKLQKLEKDIKLISKIIQGIDMSDHNFVDYNITYVQKQLQSQKDEIINIYKIINIQFSPNELPTNTFKKTFFIFENNGDEKKYLDILKMRMDKENTNPKSCIYTLPEIKNLTNTAHQTQIEIEILEKIIKELNKILSME